MASDLSVTFYGCRGSIPVSGKPFVRYGGATSCVVVTVGDREIVFDAGSGLLDYGRLLLGRYSQTRKPITTHMFITHTHFDHLIGFPYFPPLFMADTTAHIWGPRTSHFRSFEESIANLVTSPYYPVCLHEMHARKCFYDMGEADVVYFLKGQAEPVRIRPRHPDFSEMIPSPEDVECEVHCMRGYSHPKSGVNFYKVVAQGRSIVYATDTEGFVHGDRRLAQFSQDADVLIHDAMYTEESYVSLPAPTQGYGHSTVQIATTLAQQANVKQLFLFHHNPVSTDDDLDRMGETGRTAFTNTTVAKDGLRVVVS